MFRDDGGGIKRNRSACARPPEEIERRQGTIIRPVPFVSPEYLAGYVSRVQADPDSGDRSDEYVPSDLSLRVLATGGEPLGDGDGEVVLAVWVNVGAGAHRVYAGVEAATPFRDVLGFVDELRRFALMCRAKDRT